MMLRKWNYTTHQYDPHVIPDSWNVSVYEPDLNSIIQCAHCGKTLTFGDAYSSVEIHTIGGYGYGVCPECNEKEWRRKMDAIREAKK